MTNSIPQSPAKAFPQLTVLSVAGLLAEAICRVYNSDSAQHLAEAQAAGGGARRGGP